MAGGLAITQGTSDAWAEMGAQAERALNTGWIPDQRADGSGGFICNCSPSSSGYTFTSTGDASAYYVAGRRIKAVQAAGTVYATVLSAVVAGGVTTVTVVGSTGLSTGAITSLAVSPTFPGSTASNQPYDYGTGQMARLWGL